jgi:hypothetical protein
MTITLALQKLMTDPMKDSRLLIAYFPAGIGYADKSREKHGDYMRIAFLSYRSLQFEAEKGADMKLVEQARQHAASIQAMRGQELQTTACGQTVILGG